MDGRQRARGAAHVEAAANVPCPAPPAAAAPRSRSVAAAGQVQLQQAVPPLLQQRVERAAAGRGARARQKHVLQFFVL